MAGGSNGSINSLFLSAFADSEKHFSQLGVNQFNSFQFFFELFLMPSMGAIS